MAIWGQLVFYTLHEPENPEEWILHLCRLSGVESVKWVSYLEEEERWYLWNLEELDFNEIIESEVIIEVVGMLPLLAKNISIEKVAKFYNYKECLYISIGICPLSDKIYEAMSKIPEELWRTDLYQFIPGS